MKRTKLADDFYHAITMLEQTAHRYRMLLAIVDQLPELPLPEYTTCFHTAGTTWHIGHDTTAGAVPLAVMKKCLRTMSKAHWLHRVNSYRIKPSYSATEGGDFLEFTYCFTPGKGSRIAKELSYTPYDCIFINFTTPLTKEAEDLIDKISKGKCRITRDTILTEPSKASELKTTKLVCDL